VLSDVKDRLVVELAENKIHKINCEDIVFVSSVLPPSLLFMHLNSATINLKVVQTRLLTRRVKLFHLYNFILKSVPSTTALTAAGCQLGQMK
jgi:hypothetical protein